MDPAVNTRRLLVEHGGFTYDSDYYGDELPFWQTVEGKPHLIVPYSLTNNDGKYAAGMVHSDQWFGLVKDAFDVLYKEGATQPKMMSVGLHQRIIGHPGRMAGLWRLLDYIQKQRGRLGHAAGRHRQPLGRDASVSGQGVERIALSERLRAPGNHADLAGRREPDRGGAQHAEAQRHDEGQASSCPRIVQQAGDHGPAAPPTISETMSRLKIEPKCGPSKISATTGPIMR